MGALTCGAGPQERSCCSLQLGEPGWRAMVERAALLYLKSQVETGFDLYVVGKMIVFSYTVSVFFFTLGSGGCGVLVYQRVVLCIMLEKYIN